MNPFPENRIKISIEDVARALRSLRKKKSLTQQTVASALGITQGNLSKMENSHLQPSATQWMAFCLLVGVGADVILQEKKQQKSN